MGHVWFVTFEVHKRGLLPKRRNTRLTRTFQTETEAKEFARSKVDDGLVVFAGTINPHSPQLLISSSRIRHWLEGSQDPDDAFANEK